MKKIRLLSVFLVLVMSLSVLTSCDQFQSIVDMVDSAKKDAALSGDDYIAYRNPKRDEVLKKFIGTKVDKTKAELLLENIELTYYEVEGEPGKYEIVVENANKSHLYNGVIDIEGAAEKFHVNVKMLPSEWSSYFTLKLNEDPDAYMYYINGDMYEWKEEPSVKYEYYFDYQGLGDYEDYVVIDTPVISEIVVDAFAEYLYELDSIYNYDGDFTYYLITMDSFEKGEKIFKHTLEVDMEKGEVRISTEEDGSTTERTLTF
ncbi:MAG: hypothetical protein GX099_06455 [Clostridiaceae bacterium]|nr:hypothetical protein [Oscillospiraceae bacterium]NLO63051.1 hypothetical protein [Clostridiaceae bacterium]